MNVTASALKGRINHILSVSDLSWFTEQLVGECEWRYVVAMTDNHSWTVDLLVAQASIAVTKHWEATIWGWTSQDGAVIVDIGITTDNLDEAMRLGKIYSQRAVRDTTEKKEIWLS